MKTAAGEEVIQPPELRDVLVRLRPACSRRRSRRRGTDDREALLDAPERGHGLTARTATSAASTSHNHEGVVDDDVYFARFEDMTFAPVEDDPLSSTLPVINQVR